MTDETDNDGDRDRDQADAFATELDRARTLLARDDLTAFHAGGVVDGETVETTFSYRRDGTDDDREGVQALTLLATHLRIVAEEAGVEYATVASDAAALAGQVETAGDGDGDDPAPDGIENGDDETA